jgi:hydrogenase maturation protease
MTTRRHEALVLGIGNLLWADEGFGVRAVEALNAAYAFAPSVALRDGGTLGLYLYDAVASARRVLVLDAIDFGLPPGTLAVKRDSEVPAICRTKVSPHQMGLGDVLALAFLKNEAPEAVTLIGVQPEELEDLGGSLRAAVRARIDDAVELAVRELAGWGLHGARRPQGSSDAEPLNARALAMTEYEQGRPSSTDACREGDARVLALARRD